MPVSSSSMNSQLRESRLSLTNRPAPCFFPSQKQPVQVRPYFIIVCTPLPLASAAGPSPWKSTQLFPYPTCSILNFSWLIKNLLTNCQVLTSCLFFSSSRTDFLFDIQTFFLPVNLMIYSQRRGVSQSMRPKSWQPLSSLLYFYRISMQVLLLKGRMAQLWQCLGGRGLYLLRVSDFSPI